MATRAIDRGGASPLPTLTALVAMWEAIPSFSRPILARLTARMIERMDEIDGDPDLEDTEGNGPLVDERGRPLPGVEVLPGHCEDDEHNSDDEHEEAGWPTIGAQWEISAA